jgi:crotonobetainyl-CoA:carnitine CoA-transferase CaiB-like acyl-CoA transferase
VYSLQEALEDPQVAALGLMQNVQHPGRPDLKLMKAPIVVDGEFAALRSPPPLVGEHTATVLNALGYSTEAIESLRRAKVVG